MVKLNGKKKIKISVFISGRGSNLKSLIKFSKRKNSNVEIVLVVSDNKKAKGLLISKKMELNVYL